tara:strand:+ start:133 stop:645 length:513 start_codon:yes stop_codon:yes gene_type:complete
MLKHTIFEIKFGWIGIMINDNGVLRTTLPLKSLLEVQNYFGLIYQNSIQDNNHQKIKIIQKEITLYFNGEKSQINNIPVDLSNLPDFTNKVLNKCLKIPFGETRSYKWLGKELGSSKYARAVGQSLSKNPVPLIIPCHRVISISGSMQGFMGGTKRNNLKRRLIDLEKSI